MVQSGCIIWFVCAHLTTIELEISVEVKISEIYMQDFAY
jgi:hypothetical protein